MWRVGGWDYDESAAFFSSREKAEAYARWQRGPEGDIKWNVEEIGNIDPTPGETGGYRAYVHSTSPKLVECYWDHGAVPGEAPTVNGYRHSTNLYRWTVQAVASSLVAATQQATHKMAEILQQYPRGVGPEDEVPDPRFAPPHDPIKAALADLQVDQMNRDRTR